MTVALTAILALVGMALSFRLGRNHRPATVGEGALEPWMGADPLGDALRSYYRAELVRLTKMYAGAFSPADPYVWRDTSDLDA